jgi:hypothetical protein
MSEGKLTSFAFLQIEEKGIYDPERHDEPCSAYKQSIRREQRTQLNILSPLSVPILTRAQMGSGCCAGNV